MKINEALSILKNNGYTIKKNKLDEKFNPSTIDELQDILVGAYDFDISDINKFFDFFPELVDSVISNKMDFDTFIIKLKNWCGID